MLPLLWSSPAAAAIDRQSRTIALSATRSLSIEITIGALEIVGSPRTTALLELVRRAPTEAGLKRIPLEIQETDSEVRVRAVQADGATDAAFRTDVTLHVPHDARLGPLRVLEGRVRLSALHGAVEVDIRRGPIAASDVTGTIRLESGIGSVIVDKARLTDIGLLRLRAFNGDVKLSLAERPPNARVLALALNGTITSDIPLKMKDTWGPRWGEATLGSGVPVISLDVVTGKIEIRSP